jgi:hypothetical protein
MPADRSLQLRMLDAGDQDVCRAATVRLLSSATAKS